MNARYAKEPKVSSRVVKSLKLEPMTVAQIADSLGAPKSTVREALQRLEKKGVVRLAGRLQTGKRGSHSYLWRACA